MYLRDKYSLSVKEFAEKQFRHLQHTLFIAKSKILCLRTRILASLACLHSWRVYVHSCLACSRAYAFTCLACLLVFMSLRAHMPFMLAVLKYLTCLVLACFFDIICPIFVFFFNIWKVNFQKSSYRKISFYSEKYLEPSWTSMKEFLRKRIKG